MDKKLNLRSLWCIAIVILALLFFPLGKAWAQTSPLRQQFSTAGLNAIHTAEENYHISYLYDQTTTNGIFLNSADISNGFRNPAAFSPDGQFEGGVSFNYVPISKNLYQGYGSIGIPVNDMVTLYGGYMRSQAAQFAVVPLNPGLEVNGEQWAGTKVRPHDFYGLFGGALKLGYQSPWTVSAGVSYIQSFLPNGSWNGKALDDAQALAGNVSVLYRDESGLALGAGFSNISPFLLKYQSTLVRHVPGLSYLDGAYSISLPSGDNIDVAGNAGMITINNHLTGATQARYVLHYGEDNAFVMTGGYTAGQFFKGPVAGLEMVFGQVHLSTGYCFATNANPGINQFQFALTIVGVGKDKWFQ